MFWVYAHFNSDNNFQPSTSFVSLAILGNEIVVGLTFLCYGGNHMTLLALRISFDNDLVDNFDISREII